MDTASQSDNVSQGRAKTPDLKPRCVLIVDDLDDIRDVMAFMLRRHGLTILEAANGQEAIEVACLELPDLILMDLSMPIMDGFQATRQLKLLESTQQIPIIALSAHCRNHAYHDNALAAGCIACLDKPIELPILLTFLS